MLYIPLRRNIIPSFSKGQNRGRPHYPSPTFAVAFPPFFFSTLGGRIGAPLPNPAGFGGERGFLWRFRPLALREGSEPRRFQRTPGGAGPGARVGTAEAAVSVDAEITALGVKKSRLKSLPQLQLKKKVAVPVRTSELEKSSHRVRVGRGTGAHISIASGRDKASRIHCS